ncbi:hypothetical protein [Hamadaea tsunoensis]|uniref:hypothetical protein n=1 Tax=Hamadaea tsunoensis TaxID=53368 RepID=UPI0004246A4D|nr:hypothetical protein [Hamadaea tsunoensis]
METTRPETDGYILDLQDFPLDRLLWDNESILAEAVRRVTRSAQLKPHEDVAAFGNAV